MIYCPECGTANPRGSRFCNECGESLPMRTALRCPMCGTMNPVGSVHCSRCQARLIPMAAPRSEERERTEAPPREPAPPAIPRERGERQVEDVVGEVGPEAEETEDWLAQLRAAAPEEEEEEVADEEPEAMGEPVEPVELPDWLRDMGPISVETRPLPGEGVPTVEGPPQEKQEAPPMPPPIAAEVAERLEEPAPAELPDWLEETMPSEAAPAEIAPPASEGAPEEAAPSVPAPVPAEIPDWLREMAPREAAPPTAKVAPEEAPPLVAPPTPAEIPDWLQETTPPEVAAPAAEAAVEEAVSTMPPSAAVEIPDWLREAEPPEAALPEAAVEELAPAPPPPTVPEPPEWLREITREEAPEEARAPEEVPLIPSLAEFPTEAEGLARAEIPDWLQALRPRPEALQAVGEEELIETEGPLEGLTGVLIPTSTFEALALREHALPSRTSEVSLKRAELLQSLLARPARAPRPEVREPGVSLGERLQRWLVAAVLLLAVVSVLIAPFFILSEDIPTLSRPAETLTAGRRMEFHRLTRAYEVVQTMGTGDTLLVAFEYGPAEADELNLLAEPLLRHGLDRGAHVSVVSTRPAGKTVAAGLLSDIVASDERYSENQYTLSDYQTGESAGVSQLLIGVETRPELILVLTAQPGPLRWWVEQTRALYGDAVPIVAGVSAALEPAASPYLDISAGQVEGAITGLTGAAAYETLGGSAGKATQQLGALTAGHGAIVGLMILGALFYTLVGRRRRGQ